MSNVEINLKRLLKSFRYDIVSLRFSPTVVLIVFNHRCIKEDWFSSRDFFFREFVLMLFKESYCLVLIWPVPETRHSIFCFYILLFQKSPCLLVSSVWVLHRIRCGILGLSFLVFKIKGWIRWFSTILKVSIIPITSSTIFFFWLWKKLYITCTSVLCI